MKIIRIDFKKTSSLIDSSSYGSVDLSNSENIKNIEKYIIPIIAGNKGWDTEHVTIEGFKEDPSQYQNELDATLFANVHIALDDNNSPLGLIEYLEESFDNPVSITRMNNIKRLTEEKSAWEPVIKKKVVNKEVLDKFFPELKNILSNKKIYSEIGVVVKPELQGKKSGVSETLYKIMEGITFAWTNNPLVILQWRKNFKNVIFFPLFNQKVETLENLVCIALLYGDLQTYDPERWENLEFGALNSPYFVSSRDESYLELAKELLANNKITDLDLKRIEYSIKRKAVQGALFGFN